MLYTTYSIGFNDIFKKLQETEKMLTNVAYAYPPYNLINVETNKYILELAVAGWNKEEINIELADNTLKISGAKSNTENVNYIHKGIAQRSFSKNFTVADTVQITNAELIDGILRIHIENIIPEHKMPKIIPINNNIKKQIKSA